MLDIFLTLIFMASSSLLMRSGFNILLTSKFPDPTLARMLVPIDVLNRRNTTAMTASATPMMITKLLPDDGGAAVLEPVIWIRMYAN